MHTMDRINGYLHQNNVATVTWNINPKDVWSKKHLTPKQQRRALKKWQARLVKTN